MNKLFQPRLPTTSTLSAALARFFRHRFYCSNNAAGGFPATASQTLLFGLFLLASSWVNAETYRYKQPDGGVIFTDVRLSTGESKSVSIASIGSHRGYRSSYGRPTATASCSAISSQLLSTRFSSIAGALETAAAEFRVDPLLIKAIARVESCYDSSALSKAGAQGIMQLMPATARELSVTNSFDPVANIRGGAEYISKLLQRYNGDMELALAAYNAGPGAVDQHKGIPPYRETLNYVPKVLKHFAEFNRQRESGSIANR